MTDLPEVVDLAPFPFVVAGRDDRIRIVNKAAARIGFETGRSLSSYAADVKTPFVEALASNEASRSYFFRFARAEKRFTATAIITSDEVHIWFRDLTEQVALAEQVRQLRQPDQKRIRQVHHQAVTAMGYAELLEVILDDSQALSAEKIEAVRHYHADLTASLKRIQQVISEQPVEDADQRRKVIVVDSHKDLTELLTELLRTEGFRVAGFTDAGSALKYCAVNSGDIKKAVIDEAICDENNVPLSISLKALSPETEIVYLSTSNENPAAIPKPVDFQRLLEAMLD